MIDKNVIPKSWTVTNLVNICEVVTGNTPPKNDLNNYGNEIPFVKPPQLFDKPIIDAPEKLSLLGAKYARILPKNSILVTCIGNLGRTGINKVVVAFNQQINALIPLDGLSNKFIFYQAQSSNFKKQLEELASATTIPIVNKGKFQTIQISVASLSEQHRIVDKIEELFSELDKGIESLKIAQQQLKVYRQAVLKWAFEGKLTEEWRNKNYSKNLSAESLIDQIKALNEKAAEDLGKKIKHFTPVSEEQLLGLEKLPQKWKWTNLGEIISDLTDYHANGGYESLKANVTLLDFPDYAVMIRATNFEKNDFINNLKFINKTAYNFLSKSKLFGEEILIGKIGNAGKVYLMPKLNRPASLAMNLFAIRFNIPINKYVYFHLLSPFSKRQISSFVKGVGNPTIDKNSIRSLNIAVPSFEETVQIVQEIESRLSVCDKIEETIEQSLKQSEALKQSILKKAFEGKLVPQDPNDEPASKLLERIMSAKQVNGKLTTKNFKLKIQN